MKQEEDEERRETVTERARTRKAERSLTEARKFYQPVTAAEERGSNSNSLKVYESQLRTMLVIEK